MLDLKSETGRNTWGNMENTQRNWENDRWTMSKRMGKWWGNMLVVATRRISQPRSHQFSSRSIYSRIPPRMTAEYALWAQSSPLFYGFLPHMVPYAKFISMAVECGSGMFVLSFYGGSAGHTLTLERFN